MEIDFISKVIKFALSLAFVASIIIGLYEGIYSGLAIFLGVLWGAMNLFFLKHLLRNLIVRKNKNYLNIFILFGIKWPFLYLIGYELLKIKKLSTLYMMIGFSFIFLSIFIVWLKQKFQRVESFHP